MHALFHHPLIRFAPAVSCRRSLSSAPICIFTNTMSSTSLVLPSPISLNGQQPQLALGNSVSLRSSKTLGFKNGIRGFSLKNLDASKVFMSAAVGSQTVVNDALYHDYKPSCAFLFPGQV